MLQITGSTLRPLWCGLAVVALIGATFGVLRAESVPLREMTEVKGTLPRGTTWKAARSPYRVAGDLTVPAGGTLVIGPGVKVYFSGGAGFTVSGSLRAEGGANARITLVRAPGENRAWGGIWFDRTNGDNRLAYVDMDGADGAGADVGAEDSTVRLDHMTWKNVNPRRGILDFRGATSFEVSHCVFPDLGYAELVHYDGRPPRGGFAILRGNVFGSTLGYNDVVDMSIAKPPGPILQVLDNVFNGGGDDILDLDGTDAWIEGNVFHGAHATDPTNPGLSAAISGGMRYGAVPTWHLARNFFYDLDHVALVKEGAFATFVNNTAVNVSKGGIAFFEPDRRDSGRSKTLGKGVLLDGNIFWDVAEPLQYAEENGVKAEVMVRRSILPGPAVFPSPGNSNLDPRLRNTAHITEPRVDLSLKPGSGPARGTGPNGVDMGAAVPPGATLSGIPRSPTGSRGATLTVGGPQFVAYKYRLNGGAWSAPFPITRPIRLSGLAPGVNTVRVAAENPAGVWQSELDATAGTWTVR